MKKTAIKQHLSSYSIFQKRKTTLNHAFASALAPADHYDERVMDEAIRFLEQDPQGDLACVYCGGEATTWDHLVGLVKDGELRGFGHQIGNLVPCCARCNARKGSRDWQQYIDVDVEDPVRRAWLSETLSAYSERFAHKIDLETTKAACPEDWGQYVRLKEQMFVLMKEADAIAARLRANITGATSAGSTSGEPPR